MLNGHSPRYSETVVVVGLVGFDSSHTHRVHALDKD